MEVIELSARRPRAVTQRPTTCPGAKCTRRYVQPPRMQSFAPQNTYCPPSSPLDAGTTYHLSYLNVDRLARPKAFRPTQNLDVSDGKFFDDTTTKMSYKPVWGIIKAKPILPRNRQITGRGPMECMSTAKHDFVGKYVPKPEVIIPCGNIRMCNGPFEGVTTAGMSYVDPGPTDPVTSFKPQRIYRPSDEPAPKDTTQKLSFQPFRLPEKEIYPWTQKAVYRPPQAMMEGQTTYGKSFIEVDAQKEKPIIPAVTNLFPSGAPFVGKTIYAETFQPCNSDPVIPVIPCGNIALSDKKMSTDTTSKLSYQRCQAEKRAPIIPRRRNMMVDGPMQCETTSRHDFVPKLIPRADVVIPCDNIRVPENPFVGNTTTSLCYVNPGPINPVSSFKPTAKYNRLDTKIEGETVNKLSFQPWAIQPKEDLPWARKHQYQPPKAAMAGDSMYHMSYPAPGYYVEICEPEECPSPKSQGNHFCEEMLAHSRDNSV